MENLDLEFLEEVTPKTVSWDAVVLTCGNKQWTEVMQKELDIRQAKGYIGQDTIHLVVEDPKTNVGSGGATLNALLTVVEHISARRGYTAINGDVLRGTRILILHTGVNYTYEPCTRPFVCLPIERSLPTFDGPVCNIDLIFDIVTKKIAGFSSPGVWVCSSDMLLSLPDLIDLKGVFTGCDVCGVSVPQPPKLLKEHGVYKINEQGFVEDILFQTDMGTMESLARDDGSVLGVVGIVFLTQPVAEKLLAFYTKPPLDACTYMGLDSGQPPLKLSLFFDVLLPMASDVSEEAFVRGNRSSSFGKPASQASANCRFNMEYARQMLWTDLHGFKMKTCVLEGGKFQYLSHSAAEHKKNLLTCPETDGLGLTWTNRAYVEIEPSVSIADDSIVINSILAKDMIVGPRTLISHCDLSGRIKVGKDSLLTGLKMDMSKPKATGIEFPDSMVVQGYNVMLKTLGTSRYLVAVHGKHDDISAPTWKTMSTFCNQPWLLILSRTGIIREELWGSDIESDQQTIYTAKLFPVFHMTENIGLNTALWLMGSLDDDEDKSILKKWRESWRLSLSDICSFVDIGAEFDWKRQLFFKISLIDLERTLTTQGNKGFCCLYRSASVEGYTDAVLKTLDRIASETKSPGVAARTLANVADVLGAMAGNVGGLRSGPAGNKSWGKAFAYLEACSSTVMVNLEDKDGPQAEAGNFAEGVRAMAKEREKWMGRPDLLIRAARHYEGAGQIMIRQAVMTAKEFFTVESGTLPLMNTWVKAECPARIDLSGGWSDTPPITFEHGGAVTMVGILLNGEKPIGARARRIKEPVLRLKILNQVGANTEVECHNLSDLEDYCQPRAPGSLLKAAFICVDLIDLNSSSTLAQQLLDNFGCGFEIESWANLPHGSGMGTSSILAGAVLAVLLTAAGKSVETTGLIHAVLYLEQLLTTGGGWQDQIGGLVGGVCLGISEACLPLRVDVNELNISPEYISRFNDRLVLIYTGKTRLARNLLQDVVRNWYARNPHILQTDNTLIKLARECAHSFMDGDFEAVGECVGTYWEMKKRMAPGCESVTIARIMSILKPYTYGMCSAGAGGGGFIYGILKEPRCQNLIRELLAQQEDLEAEVYDATVDESGLSITVE